jgi:retrotransposon gag protein
MALPATTIEDLLRQVQEENQQIRAENRQLLELMQQLQLRHAGGSSRPSEPKIRLPEKYDGARSRFRGFMLQVRNVLQMHPHRYPDDRTKVGLIGSLLAPGTAALDWFSPLIEKDADILHDFDEFTRLFEECFGEPDRERIAANRVAELRQGTRPAATYISEFRRIAADLAWNEPALIEACRRGLSDEIKDMLVHRSKPTTLNELVQVAVDCDNRLSERRQERRRQPGRPLVPVHAPTPDAGAGTAPTPAAARPEPMQVDRARPRHLSAAERLRRRELNLCLYCGGADHHIRQCPIRPAVRQITTGDGDAPPGEPLNDQVQHA